MNEAAIYTMRENEQFIHQRHLSMAIDKVMMGERSDRESNLKRRSALPYMNWDMLLWQSLCVPAV